MKDTLKIEIFGSFFGMVKIATKTVSTTGTVGTNTWEWKSTV